MKSTTSLKLRQSFCDLGAVFQGKERKVKFLSKKAIQQIKLAEAQASDIRAQAEARAQTMIENTKKVCVAETEQGIAQAKTRLKAEVNALQKKADELVAQSGSEVEESIAAVRAQAKNQMQAAVKLIVWEMYDSCQ